MSSHPRMLHFVRTAPVAVPRRAQVGKLQPARSPGSHITVTHSDDSSLQVHAIVSNRGSRHPTGFPADPGRGERHSAVRDRRPSESRTAEALPILGPPTRHRSARRTHPRAHSTRLKA
ncbi:hypothetical protein SSCG_02604 [Streptomyces clavuligerus]|nr:hypothetical protein SSCG_02604 [Streptomyces clavuligerus]